MTNLQWKWAGVVALFALAIALLYPSINWYSLEESQRDRLEQGRLRPKHLLNLGLDLKGGSHFVMELDVAKLPPDADLRDALSRAQEIVRNRIDEFGVAEPLIAQQGQRWIVIQLPGIKDSRRAKELIGGTALLEFRMVDDSEEATRARQLIFEKVGDPFIRTPGEGIAVSSAAAALLPKGTALFRARADEAPFYILKDTVPITGDLLDSARVEQGSNGLPTVAFKWKPEGGKTFWNLTSAHVGKNMAIVLDRVVQSAPVIRSPIRDSGVIEGTFSMEEARDLAIKLRSGALPAPLNIIEERTVGATLGDDSILTGLRACLLGGCLVFAFMAWYYKLGGVFADAAMLLNTLFVLSLMAYFNATLTLPGIAGLLLTIGMTIDSNVLIFERIREELRLGKPTRIAVDVGYDKAFSSIFDSNVTALVAALFLFQFGTGPIKGFAVTLTLGILCSMFTSIIVTRLMFSAYLATGPVGRLRI